MEPMQFVQSFRFPEIHIFDLCKYIQKCRQCSVQDGQLFCPQPRQCVSAGKPLGISAISRLLNEFVGIFVDSLGVIGINTGLYGTADPKHSTGSGNTDKQKR